MTPSKPHGTRTPSRPHRWLLGACAGGFAFALAACVVDDTAAIGDTAESEDAINVNTGALWDDTQIRVCWENPTSDNASDRQWIMEAVTYWWNYRAGFGFYGWAPCGDTETGLRVQITDTPDDRNQSPHVKTVGRWLANVRNGLIMPHTYSNHWRTECRGSGRQKCQQEYAVHEFGHVLGFEHEQGRTDTPEWCQVDDARGSGFETYGSPWDPESVMGYCSAPRLGGGQLSGFDIYYSMYAYGTDRSKVYFFEDFSQDYRTGKKTGWYQGGGCHNVFSHHNDLYSAVYLGRGVRGVRVWRDWNCSGPSTLLTTSQYLGGWNDTVSSLEIWY